VGQQAYNINVFMHSFFLLQDSTVKELEARIKTLKVEGDSSKEVV